jgi:hypothetical protein
MYSRKVIGYLGFSRREVFIGEEAASEVDQGAHTTGRRGPGVGRAPGGVATLWSGSISSLMFWKLREISGRLALVSYVTFLKHKNNRKQGTDTVASR